jgi:hypothetical protein
MCNIEIEKQSQMGMHFFHKIKRIVRLYKEDNYLNVSSGRTSFAIALVKEGGKREYIHSFFHEEIRDLIFEKITNVPENVTFVIPLTCFRNRMWSEVEANNILRGYRFSARYLTYALLRAERMSQKSARELDAFKDFSNHAIAEIKDGKKRIIINKDPEELSLLWGATLFTPQVVTGDGVTPEQFFKHITLKCQ